MNLALVIYAQNMHPLADFYAEVFGFQQTQHDATFIRLVKDTAELIILQVSDEYKSVSGHPRESTAIKPVFVISESIADLRPSVILHGGVLKPVQAEWHFNDMTLCDGHDPEGNVFQVRTQVPD